METMRFDVSSSDDATGDDSALLVIIHSLETHVCKRTQHSAAGALKLNHIGPRNIYARTD